MTSTIKTFNRLLLAVLLAGTSVADASHGILQAGQGHVPLAGFLVLAEHRFDPAIQRLMAERSLRALPLRDGQLYYVVADPGGTTLLNLVRSCRPLDEAELVPGPSTRFLAEIAEELGIPIRFVGVGEAAEDLRVFRADEFVSALLEH